MTFRPSAEPDASADLTGFDPVRCIQFAKNVGDMDARRLLADEQLLGDLPIASSGREVAQHLDLSRRQTQVAGRRRWAPLRLGRVERDPRATRFSMRRRRDSAPSSVAILQAVERLSLAALRFPRPSSCASASRQRQ